MKLDLRPRCQRCGKLITKGKQAQEDYQHYRPFCSYHCQQWGAIDDARRHIARATGEQT